LIIVTQHERPPNGCNQIGSVLMLLLLLLLLLLLMLLLLLLHEAR
jgi:hypothetical protein